MIPVFLMGCAQGPMIEEVPADLPTRAAVADVPIIKQEDFYCGPAALAMTMGWGGAQVDQEALARLMFSPGAKGTYRTDMLGAARREGQLAVEVEGLKMVLGEVAAGHPVIILQNLGLTWAPVWHYAVVVGYDAAKEEIYLHSGQHDRMTMDLVTFQRTWARAEDWAVVVMPPGQLPELAEEWEVLRAAAGLERAGRHREAERAYAAGARRWPGSWLWQFGLGNARYNQGDLRGARQAFRRALAIDGTVPEVRNNLAQVEAELAGGS
ncbi:MAG: PA2778 family cysteine peptidase [Rhodobacteraceae bacterium]|nr:PA2778 family cysteine peptidase [Paracoccaceae bacterium]